MIVVTGAAGRLGRRVVQLFLDRGIEVLATDQVAADDLSTEFALCDLLDAKMVERLLKGAEGVIHMGADLNRVAVEIEIVGEIVFPVPTRSGTPNHRP